jgi:alpha-glucosidase
MPFVYYGEELGMGDVPVTPEESIDAAASRVAPGFTWWDRSQARTPMPWNGGPLGGFTTGTPWLKLAPDTATRNVEAQLADQDSVLACYRRVIGARRQLPSIQDGALAIIEQTDDDVVAYRRRGSGDDVLVAVSFGGDGGDVRLPRPPKGRRWRTVVGASRDPVQPEADGHRLRLEGIDAVILAAERRTGRASGR